MVKPQVFPGRLGPSNRGESTTTPQNKNQKKKTTMRKRKKEKERTKDQQKRDENKTQRNDRMGTARPRWVRSSQHSVRNGRRKVEAHPIARRPLKTHPTSFLGPVGGERQFFCRPSRGLSSRNTQRIVLSRNL